MILSDTVNSTNQASGNSMWPQILDLLIKAEKMRVKHNIDEAKILLYQAREMNKKLGEQQLEALILESFGYCYEQSGDYEAAKMMASDAIDIFKKLPGPVGKIGKANGLTSLGNIHRKLGKYNEAISYQEQAIEILLKLTKEHPKGMDGQYKNKTIERKLKLVKESTSLYYKNLLAISYGNMGETLAAMKEYKRGLELSHEALKISQKTGDKFEQARNLHNIGNTLYALGKIRESIKSCAESARIFTEIDNKKGVSMSYGVLAMGYEAMGDIESAKRYYQLCIEINLCLKQFDDLAIAYGNQGLLYKKIAFGQFLGRSDAKKTLKSSVENFKLAIESTDTILANLSVDNNRTAFSDRFYRWYDELTAPFNLSGRCAAALLFLDLGRAKILRQLVYKQVNLQENNEDQLALESSWLTIQNEKEKERICDLSKNIQLLESDATVLFYNFNHYNLLTIWVLDAYGCVSLKTSDPDEISSTAEEELDVNVTGLLEQASVALPRGYCFFNQLAVVNFEDKTAKTANHDEKEAKESETKRNYRSPAKRAHGPSDDLTKKARLRLYRALISPVRSFIKGTKLIIVPQRCLFFAPFSSFIDENGCMLSEKYQIQVIPSIHVLAMSIQSSSGKPVGGSLFVGDPEVQLAGLLRLPCAAEEVEHLASFLDSKPLLGPMATKKKVLELMPKASIIHIAAHGHEHTGHIFLAPEANQSIDHQTSSSYLLTQSDILKCKLTARLVVLSCCDTGKGEVSSEGVLGIARSFLGAGASSILVTLWKINDKFAKLFMTAFYHNILEGKSVCLALKETMNEFQRSEEYKSFMFWAAFEIMGEDVRFSKTDIKEIRRNNKLKRKQEEIASCMLSSA